jgi:hypothetical protein
MSQNHETPEISKESIVELKASTRKEVEDNLSKNIFYGLQQSLDSIENYKLIAGNSQKFASYAVYVSIILLVVAVAGWYRSVDPVYIIQNADGSAYRTTATGAPFINNKTLQTFGREVAVGFHTFSYRNYVEKFREMKDYCSDDVIREIFNRYKKTGVFTTAADYSQRYESIATKMEVVQQYPKENPTMWELRGVVNEEILSASGVPVKNNFKVVIKVERVPLNESYRGIKCVGIAESYE